MFKCDILEERKQRQLDNDKVVEKLLRANLPVQYLKKNKCVNDKAVDRCLEANLSFNNLDENTIGFVAKLISVSATRQGSTDELYIVNGINDALVGMSLEKPEKEIRIDGIDKSIDAVLKNHNGAIIGHVFCKVVDGGGGHQYNVKDEALRFLEYASKQNDALLRVCLVDGKYKWKNKAEQYLSEDVWLCDHQQFQDKLRERYGVKLKEIDKTNPVKNPLEKFFHADAA
tara:strand:- start:250 stop:936 length:687 start_codon:yes stop_codon:yes gene_type:complete